MKNNLFLSLGSNIPPETVHLSQAVDLLNAEFKFLKISSLYKTAPVDYEDQSDFYNLCVKYETKIDDPFKILDIVKGIEREVGRKKGLAKGPRKIDIDIIFFGEYSVTADKLTIPHSRMQYRKFVLEPLIEILEIFKEDSFYLKKYDLINKNKKINDQKVVKIGELKLG
jgi:2-amino-4-hydroxy-6-hydroxymethyldihydropteridine diphosphokinase